MPEEESTTLDLVELTRGFFETANRRDFDAVPGIFAADAVWESQPLGTSFKGRTAIRGFIEDWWGSYEEYEFEAEEILDLGHGVVFTVARQDARPVGSTGRVQTRAVFTSEWEERMIVRVTVYYDIDEARAAAERLAEERG